MARELVVEYTCDMCGRTHIMPAPRNAALFGIRSAELPSEAWCIIETQTRRFDVCSEACARQVLSLEMDSSNGEGE